MLNGLTILLVLMGLVVLGLAIRGRRLGESNYSRVYILFFFSGFPALIYQIVWQRSLFEIYGVNIESVTIVVTAFMLGLGLGSLFGGYLSKSMRVPLLLLFGAMEIGIAAYGLVSLRVFHLVAVFTAGHSTLTTGVMSFLLVLLPTILMGATLPLLVEHLVRVSKNVGHSVGMLYFVNTLGSAAACFMAVAVMMRVLGQSGSVRVAAVINIVIGSLVLLMHFRVKNRNVASSMVTAEAQGEPENAGLLPFKVAMAISCLSGFIALGYEILWYRLFSFATTGLAKAFPLLLGTYLAGIAFGSLFTEWFCRRRHSYGAEQQLGIVGVLVVFANVIGFLVAPFLANTIVFFGLSGGLAIVLIAAAMLGATFPLVAHISISPRDRAGARLSYLYLSNIIGSASGSFVIGFILMDHFSLRGMSVLLSLAGIGMGLALLAVATRGDTRRLATAMALCLLMAGTVTLTSGNLFDRLYEKLLYKQSWQGQRFLYTVETRSGVVNVADDGTVYGGGIYDGHFNTDVVHDSNIVLRAYALSAFHPDPKQVLMVGLSSGSWAQVIANNPEVEKLTIVEINPGYLQLIRRYSQVASLLRNPKVQIIIDDGRRWLVANPDRKFDAIVMNTTFNYRDHASALLSKEFLYLIRKHLNPGGVHYFNTTGSPEVFRTGATVFPHTMRVFNFLVVSDSPIQVDVERWRRVLVNYKIDGKPVFHLDRPEEVACLNGILSFAQHLEPNNRFDAFELGANYAKLFANRRLITDDNMGTEWFY